MQLAYLKKVVNLFLENHPAQQNSTLYKDRKMKSKPKALYVAENGMLSPDATISFFFSTN